MIHAQTTDSKLRAVGGLSVIQSMELSMICRKVAGLLRRATVQAEFVVYSL